MKTKMTKQLFALLLFLMPYYLVNAQVDPAILWQIKFGGDSTEYETLPLTMKSKTTDGGYIFTITSNSNISGNKTENSNGLKDCWVIKTDSSGAIIWQNSIGGNLEDKSAYIEQTSDGGYILGCNSVSNISGDKSENSRGGGDYWIIKLDASGNISWQKTYGGSNQEVLVSIHQTSDGGYIVGGISRSPLSGDVTEGNLLLNDEDIWVLKLNNLGLIEWQNTINTLGDEDLGDVIQTIDGGYFIVSSTAAGISGDKTENPIGGTDFWVIKLNTFGVLQWQNTIGGDNDDVAHSVVQTSDGGYLIGGHSDSYISGDKTSDLIGSVDYWLLKLNAMGVVMWDKSYGGVDAAAFLQDMKVQSDGGFLLAGTASGINISIGDQTEVFKSRGDYWIVNTDALGNIKWHNVIGSMEFDYIYSIEALGDGNILIVGGQSQSASSGDITLNGFGESDMVIMKLKMPNHIIHGNIYYDINLNCSNDTINEPGIMNKIIVDHMSGNTAITGVSGNYKIPVYNNQALISVANLISFENIGCLSSDSIYLAFDTTSSFDTFNVDFPVRAPLCHFLAVDINSSSLNVCSYQTYNITYSNIGYDTAHNAVIHVLIDTAVLGSFSSSIPYTLSNDTLLFSIGNIAPFQSGSITFTALVECDAVIGTSTCVQAYIYPQTNCPPPIVGYDSSDIEVQTTCSNDTVYTLLKNNGSDMSSPGIITAIDDEIIQQTDTFILNAGLNVTFDYYVSPNSTLTLLVQQNPNHPNKPIIIKHDELCALTSPIKINSVINHFPRYDDAPSYEEVCSRILAAYDPNMKSVVPQGFTSQHYTDSNQILEYRIDFQNTGLDTARRVVLVDTLSNWLDVSTFVPLVSSHSYITQFVGSNIVHFIFDPISLPDSNASVPNSQGYVTFKIRPKYNTPKGTVINNFADIYFDYNAPVRTNTVFNTIYDTVLVRIGVGLNEPKENTEAQVLVFPNPTIDKFYIKLDQEVQDAHIKLVDVSGREIYQMNHIQGSEIEMKAAGISKGLYYIQIYNKHKLIARSKVLIQ